MTKSSNPPSSVIGDLKTTLIEFEDIYSQAKLVHDEGGERLKVIEVVPTVLGQLPVFDFVQWTSSFTMEQIPNEQMMQWLKGCVDRLVRNCSPSRVLDVGCGTGLLFFEWIVRLAQQHGKSTFHNHFEYTGIELSVECTELLQERIQTYVPEVLPVTRVFPGAAHDVQFDNNEWWSSTSSELTNRVDTVVINSVMMYLPSIDYVNNIFTTFAQHVQPGGAIYCGDVRDSRSLRLFYYSIAVEREGLSGFDAESPAVQKLVDDAIANDPHLLVSPLDYIRFAAQFNMNTDVHGRQVHLLMEPKLSTLAYTSAFEPQQGEAAEDVPFRFANLDNEMTRFRFDATLYVDVVPPPTSGQCRVALPVDSETGELLHTHVVAFNADIYLTSPTSHLASHPTTPPHEQLTNIVESLVAPRSREDEAYGLFTYPHVPVLVDALLIRSLLDKEGKCLAEEQRKPVRAAQNLLSPMQLLQWFEAHHFSSQWQLLVTLHPRDPLLLVCIVAPKDAVVRISYPLVIRSRDSAGFRLLSSQPKSAPRQAHFYNIPDVVDGWLVDAMQRVNSTTTLFPAPPEPMGSALWKSMELTCSQFPSEVVVVQPVTKEQVTWGQFAAWSDALAEALADSVKPGDVIIQFVDRSIDQIVGMLATFSLGAVFAPLAAAPNPDPPARIAKVFSDCRPRVLLTQAHLVDHLEESLNYCPPEVRANIRIVCAVEYRHKANSLPLSLTTIIQRRRGFWAPPGAGACVTADDAAYCIYTSGSTSLPKAVVLTHANFHHLVCAFHVGSPGTVPYKSSNENGDGRIPSITIPSMRTLQTTAASFDLHVYECLAPLYYPYLAQASSGHEKLDGLASQLVLLPPGALDIEAYATTIDAGKATHVVCTPTMLGSLSEYCTLANCWAKLRHVRVWRTGGEALKQSTVDDVLERLRAHNPSVELWCSYGPAECTDSATMSRSETSLVRGYAAPAWTPYVTIGRPLANYGIYVVVEAGEDEDPAHFPRLARAGEAGMIYLAGPAVYKGYLQRDDLTASVRKQMEFGGDMITIYRTGDKGKYSYHRTGIFDVTTADNHTRSLAQFWHLGRTDFAQVKLRGQRIETTEIESVFMQHGDVSHTIVCKHIASSHQHDEEFLVAYFSIRADSASKISAERVAKDLRSLAMRSFPAFMVPTSYTFVAEFQTNRNGKVDRKLLPPPHHHRIEQSLDASSTTMNSSFLSDASSSQMVEPCKDVRLLWLRQQLLFHWLATVPSPSAEIFLKVTPTCHEPPFTHNWMELGASSITLMRFIARLKVFIHQWLHAPRNEATPEHASAIARVSAPPLKPPLLSDAAVKELQNLLTFPQVYKHRHINGITKALLHVLFPEPPAALRKKDRSQPLDLAQEEQTHSADVAKDVATTHSIIPTILCATTNPPEPTPAVFRRKWMLIIASVWIHRNVLFLLRWVWDLFLVVLGRRTSTSRKLYDPLRLPGTTQQSIFYLDEQKRLEDYSSISSTPEDDMKQYRFFNCPYVLRIKQSSSEGEAPSQPLTLRQAQGIVRHLEGIMQHTLQVNPSVRVTLEWDADRIVQYVFDLNDQLHKDVHRFQPEYVYRDAHGTAADGYFAFSCTDASTQLTYAVQRAAREKIQITDKTALFRFKAFYELPQEARGVLVNDDALLDAPILSLHVMLNFHHAAFDGHSMQQVLREIVARAALSPSGAVSTSLPRAPLRKLDPFFRFCAEVASGRHLLSHQSDIYYWLRHMEGWRPTTVTKFMPRTTTHEDGKWPTHRRFFSTVGKLRTFLSPDEGDVVKRICRKRHWTPYSLFMGVYYLVLSIVQHEKAASQGTLADPDAPLDLCIGSAFSTRMHAPDLHNRLCCFSDIYPFRLSNLRLRHATFSDLVSAVQEMLMTHMEHSTVDVGTILVMMGMQQTVDAVQLVRTPLVNPLFAPVMLYEDVEYCQVQKHVALGGSAGASVDLELLDLPDFGALAEIQLKVNELLPTSTPDQSPLSLTWEYASELYDAAVMRRIADNYNTILQAVLSVHDGHPLHDTLETLCNLCLTPHK